MVLLPRGSNYNYKTLYVEPSGGGEKRLVFRACAARVCVPRGVVRGGVARSKRSSFFWCRSFFSSARASVHFLRLSEFNFCQTHITPRISMDEEKDDARGLGKEDGVGGYSFRKRRRLKRGAAVVVVLACIAVTLFALRSHNSSSDDAIASADALTITSTGSGGGAVAAAAASGGGASKAAGRHAKRVHGGSNALAAVPLVDGGVVVGASAGGRGKKRGGAFEARVGTFHNVILQPRHQLMTPRVRSMQPL
jgi:hypothetical protein